MWLTYSQAAVLACLAASAQAMCPFASRFRPPSGHCNNMYDPQMGSQGMQYLPHGGMDRNMLENTFMSGRPNPRLISNVIFDHGPEDIPDPRGLSHMIMQWGQFIDHDLTETLNLEKTRADIPIVESLEFQNKMQGGLKMAFTRCEGWHNNTMFNNITHFLDASMVYGSDEDWQAQLLIPGTAKLNLTDMGLLRYSMIRQPIAGDNRADTQPGLSSLQTLFAREHNRLVDILMEDHVSMDVEEQFNLARIIVESEIQKITWDDWLPALLGVRMKAAPYDNMTTPGVPRLFAGSVFRVGHSMVSNRFDRYDYMDYDEQNKKYRMHKAGPANLSDIFFRYDQHMNETGNMIEPFLIGLWQQPMERIDHKVVDAMRNHLFRGHTTWGGGYTESLDIVSVNIQRGRDLALYDYRMARALFTGDIIDRFDQITADPYLRRKLRALYNNRLDNIDPFVGMLSEDHAEGASVGPMIKEALKIAFGNLQKTDRLWYHFRLPKEIEMQCMPGSTKSQRLCDLKRAILNGTWGLDDIILANTKIMHVPENVFVLPGFEKMHMDYPEEEHMSMPFVNLTLPAYNMADDQETLVVNPTDGKPLKGMAAITHMMKTEMMGSTHLEQMVMDAEKFDQKLMMMQDDEAKEMAQAEDSMSFEAILRAHGMEPDTEAKVLAMMNIPRPYMDEVHQMMMEHEMMPTSSMMHEPMPTSSMMHEPMPTSSMMHEPMPTSSMMHEPMPTSSMMHKPMPTSSMMHEPMPTSSMMHEPMPTSSMMHEPMPTSSMMHEPMPTPTAGVMVHTDAMAKPSSMDPMEKSDMPMATTGMMAHTEAASTFKPMDVADMLRADMIMKSLAHPPMTPTPTPTVGAAMTQHVESPSMVKPMGVADMVHADVMEKSMEKPPMTAAPVETAGAALVALHEAMKGIEEAATMMIKQMESITKEPMATDSPVEKLVLADGMEKAMEGTGRSVMHVDLAAMPTPTADAMKHEMSVQEMVGADGMEKSMVKQDPMPTPAGGVQVL